jgi:hypothetical protein
MADKTLTEVVEQTRKGSRFRSKQAYDAALRALPADLSTLGQQEAGAFFRTVATGVVDKYAPAAKLQAWGHYLDTRKLFIADNDAVGNILQQIDNPIPVSRIDNIVAGAMVEFQKGNYKGAREIFGQKTATAIVDTWREETLAFGAADPENNGFERSAGATACAFCQSIDGAKVSSIDAMELHDNCTCVVVPSF